MTIWNKKDGLEIDLNDEAATIEHARSLGWTMKGEGLTLDEMTKDELKVYAKERFQVELDLNKTKPILLEEVKALEDVNGN